MFDNEETVDIQGRISLKKHSKSHNHLKTDLGYEERFI
jgi:hypothetical protein